MNEPAVPGADPGQEGRAPRTPQHAPAPSGTGGAVSPVPTASETPSRWGRVDADGTVYVFTADGEQPVGSWHAGEVGEGLLHFARRFDDLRTEAELLHTRLAWGAADPARTRTAALHLHESLAQPAVVGDLAALRARVEEVFSECDAALAEAKHVKGEQRRRAAARKEELAAEAEGIAAESTQWKAAGDRLRHILEEWKTVRGLDRKTDEELWKRFSAAREAFNRRRGAHFAELDKQRAAAKDRKTALVEAAESLADSDDWAPTAARLKELMAEWKATGRAPRDTDDALWARFRAAQDAFFSRRAAARDEREAEFAENARRKDALLAEAANVDPSAGADTARAALRDLQQRWEAIGKVPKDRVRELEDRMKAAEDRIRSGVENRARAAGGEAAGRAAQFRERVEQFETRAAKARAAGDARRAEHAEAQAAQWREWLATAEQAVASP
jgi:hypothetical protein